MIYVFRMGWIYRQINIDIRRLRSRSNGWIKDIWVNAKGISNGIYNIILDPSNADQMERQGVDGIVLIRTEDKSIGSTDS